MRGFERVGTVTFSRLEPATISFAAIVRRAAEPADAVEFRRALLDWSACPENALVAPLPPNGRAGGVAPIVNVLFTVNVCHFRKGKMLDPSGCFQSTFPRITVLVLLGADAEHSMSGCKYVCEQSVLQINPKSAHAPKLCPFTRNRLSLNGW